MATGKIKASANVAGTINIPTKLATYSGVTTDTVDITGKTNIPTKDVYYGATTDTAEVLVDNTNRLISVNVNTNTIQEKLISGVNIKTINSEPLLGSGNIDIDVGYAVWGNISGNLSDQADLQNALNNKQDKLDFNSEIPAGGEIVPLYSIKDADTYYTIVNTEVRAGGLNNFTFEDGKEVTYTATISSNCTLTIPSTINQGFISLLTISNMAANKTIIIQKESQEIPFNIRIVSGTTVLPGDSFVTSIAGKKIIFARCDGADIEILVIEELGG